MKRDGIDRCRYNFFIIPPSIEGGPVEATIWCRKSNTRAIIPPSIEGGPVEAHHLQFEEYLNPHHSALN